MPPPRPPLRPRKIFGHWDGLSDFFAHEQNRPTKAGTVELQMSKNFTPEEEDREVMAFFKEIERDFGFRNIHTIRVVPDDVSRKPYYVHVDNLERK